MTRATRTLGIDLASKANRTAICLVEWQGNKGRVLEPTGDRLTDETLMREIQDERVSKVGVDAPFGWPVEFVDAVVAWRDRQEWSIPLGDPEERQSKLVLRETDLAVVDATRLPLAPGSPERRPKWPLRVSADRIAFTAMRCARLLAAVGTAEGPPVDRAGSGTLLEVYPDAAIREWGLWREDWDRPKQLTYKGGSSGAKERREVMTTAILGETRSRLQTYPNFVADCIESDDVLDAFICALVARAVESNASQPVTNRKRAEAEGWIHLPTPGSLEVLLGP